MSLSVGEQKYNLIQYSTLEPKSRITLIPLHPWNKTKKGKNGKIRDMGKSPRELGWTTKEYRTLEDTKGNISFAVKWLSAGYNVGFRLESEMVVVDIDPRNDTTDSLALEDDVAQLFDPVFETIDDVAAAGWPVVCTGGGGYHIYCTLPPMQDLADEMFENVENLIFRECLTPEMGGLGGGVELKTAAHGRQVVAAGSRHPSGEYYLWHEHTQRMFEEVDLNGCDYDIPLLPEGVLGKYLKIIDAESAAKKKSNDHELYGVLTGEQLKVMILDKLDVLSFNSAHDKWLSLMAAANHATAGVGVDEWVHWCLGDPQYSGDEGQIRARWDSFSAHGSSIGNNVSTVASLIHTVKEVGGSVGEIKAALDFADESGSEEFEESDYTPTETAEKEIRDIKNNHRDRAEHRFEEMAEELGDELAETDVEAEVVKERVFGQGGVEGSVADNLNAAVESLSQSSTDEEVLIAVRLILAADVLSAERAKEKLVGKKIISKTALNSLLRGVRQEENVAQDIANKICKLCLKKLWNDGKHIVTTPEGEQWMYTGKVWVATNAGYVKKLIYGVLRKLRIKGEFVGNDNSMLNEIFSLLVIMTATQHDPLGRLETPKSVINCLNGELWIDAATGKVTLRKHNYENFLNTILEVDYDPSAQCPLWDRTVSEIFSDVDGEEDLDGMVERDEMVRHLHEVMGYMIQPYKNIASYFLWRGPGGDGKSTVLKVMAGLLQNAYVSGTIKLLGSGGSGGYEHATAALVGKLMAVIEEVPANMMLDDAGLKMLSENTTMQANPKGAAQFQFQYCAGLVMCSNGWPRFRDVSNGMMRRTNVIPFTREFEKKTSWGGITTVVEDREHKLDRDRAKNIIESPEEMAGVLNRCLEGLVRLRRRIAETTVAFDAPNTCLEARDKWLTSGNDLLSFIGAVIQRDEDLDHGKDMRLVPNKHRPTFAEVFAEYYDWCAENDIPSFHRKGKKAFKQELSTAGIVIKVGAGNKLWVYGMRIRDSWLEREDEFSEGDEKSEVVDHFLEG